MSNHKLLWILMISVVSVGAGCRYDMQDQPRYKQFKKSEFFADNKAMRELPEGTVARGQLREDKAFYQGKTANAANEVAAASASGAAATSATDASGNTVVTSFPGAIEKSPVPVTAELLAKGEERYKVFCIVCHGPVGNGDGMIVRRGYPKPPSYNDDRLRGAPDGHYFDVITNGWGKMNSYGSMIPTADRWAIVAYIRALQISQNPNPNMQTNTNQPGTVQNRPTGSITTETQNNGGQNQ